MKKNFHFLAFFLFTSQIQFFYNRLTDTVHEQTHFGNVIHVQYVVQSEFRTSDNTVERVKISIMIQHILLPPLQMVREAPLCRGVPRDNRCQK